MKGFTREMLDWFMGGDTGISSETIMYFCVTGDLPKRRSCPPSDPSDFGRCHRLIEEFPQIKKEFRRIKTYSQQWGRLIDHWDELTALYLEEKASGSCPKLYKRMKELQNG